MYIENFEGGKPERISIRLNHEIKHKIERAAALDHRSITSFIISSAIESADEVLKRDNYISLSEKDWDIFYEALNNPPKPNKALRKALADYKNADIKSDI